MVGRRKGKGLGVRAVESVGRASRHQLARVAAGTTPSARVRAMAEVTASVIRRLPPHVAAQAAKDAIRALDEINRKYEKEVAR
jgi:hypothetical protein